MKPQKANSADGTSTRHAAQISVLCLFSLASILMQAKDLLAHHPIRFELLFDDCTLVLVIM